MTDIKFEETFMYYSNMKDSEITKNLIVFFLLIAGLTFILGLLGYLFKNRNLDKI